MNDLQALATRARAGDPSAMSTLRGELQAQMARIVRRAVRCGTARSPLDRRILAEVGQTMPQDRHWPTSQREQTIDRVANRICESVIDRLQTCPENNLRMYETVCD